MPNILTKGIVSCGIMPRKIQYNNPVPKETKRKSRKPRTGKTGRRQIKKAISPSPIYFCSLFVTDGRRNQKQTQTPPPQTMSNNKFSTILSAITAISDSIKQIPHCNPPNNSNINTRTCRSRKSDRIRIRRGINKSSSIVFSLWLFPSILYPD